MTRRLLVWLVAVVALGAGYALFAASPSPARVEAPPATLVLATPGSAPAFARALAPRTFTFPADHGPHPEYQTEWWYYTGNLDDENGHHYGYQLTFFRRGLTPDSQPRSSDLGITQIYFAHFAIADVGAGRHAFAERFSRGTPSLAGASGEPYSVWLESWRVDSLSPEGDKVHLQASQDDMQLDLTLSAAKPVTLHGDQGLSYKDSVAGNASYYLSYTRMRTQGSLSLDGRQAAVAGTSWFDHEWSTSALPAGAVGWDWFSLQLDDGRDVMFFEIRNADGSIDPSAAGTLVDDDGASHRLSATDVVLERSSTWRSPDSGAEYPLRWRLSIPDAGLDLTLEPWLEDQEMRVSFTYWEGAVRIVDTRSGRVLGQGYVELTGYAESLQGTF